MADIGAYAGVGMSALYRRYPSKHALVASLVAETRAAYEAEIARATQRLRAGDPAWDVYTCFLGALVDANAHFVTPGSPQIAHILEQDPTTWHALTHQNQALFATVQATGVLRPGIEFIDIGLLLGAISAVRGENPERSHHLRRRVLAVVIDGLRPELAPLTGQTPTTADYQAP